MEDTAIQVLSQFESISYWGIFGLSLLANMVIPVPEEFFLLALGYIGGAGSINLFFTAPLVVIGLFISDMVLFSLARNGNRFIAILHKRVKNNRFFEDESFVARNIRAIIFISRFVIQFRFIGPVLAGAIRTPWRTFLFWDFIALCVYVPFILWVGNYFHSRFSEIINGVSLARNIIVGILVFLTLSFIAGKIRKKFFSDYVFTTKEDGYVDTWIPGIKKQVASFPFEK
jgi:membrane protein DedA with SNARE-associated domain